MLTNIVGAIAESARSHENRQELVESESEENNCCRELIREQEGLGPVIRLIASTSPGADSMAMVEF